MLLVSLSLAWRTLMLNKVRSVLTLLGMIIGVGAVIAIVSLGEGLRASFAAQMTSLGSNIVYMMPLAPKRPGQAEGRMEPFDMHDIDALNTYASTVKLATPSIIAGVNVKFRTTAKDAQVVGTDEQYLDYSSTAKMDKGVFFTKSDLAGATRKVVIGDDLAKDMFPEGLNPIGQILKLNGVNYQVIGMFQHYTGMIHEGADVNKSLVAPVTTVQRRILGSNDVFWVTIFLRDNVDLQAAKEELATLMRQRRGIRNAADDDFQFISPDDFAEMGNQFINVMIAIFGAIAFMSLLVGGVGIMNIMLVSVTERTKEIGLRMALGAGRTAVLSQFMVEAILLTLLGGLFGLVAGYGGAWGVSLVLKSVLKTQWNPAIPLVWVLVSIFVSVLIGLIFGTYPAYKGSQLDPVEAMRYE
jgi:putative ABC transport system permease protein